MLVEGATRTVLAKACLFCVLCFSGCSKSSDSPNEPASMPQVSQQTLDAVREYRNEPIKRARMTHSLGDERTQAIDEALKQ
jgi:hypothetical protein